MIMTPNNQKPGIILAAGLGTRMRNLPCQSRPKPLTVVCGISLLIRTIRSLKLAGCHEIVIVLGYQAEELEKEIISRYKGEVRLKFAVNEKYELQNGVSVLCSRPFVDGEFILTMADHVFDEDIMYLVRHHKPPDNGATLCVDYKLDSIYDMDDATKVLEKGGHIQTIGKSITNYNCIDTGIFIGTKGLMDAISEVYHQNGDVSLSEGVQLLAQRGKMKVLDIKNAFWQDVDTPEMMTHAEILLKKHNKI